MANPSSPMTRVQRALVTDNLDLAHHLALEAWRRNPVSQDKEEVVAVAYEGLATAAIRFDPARANVVNGVADLPGAFAGYARRRITGAILDWQRTRDHVPRRQRRAYKDLQALGYGTGRSASELADLTGMSQDRIRLIIAAVESPVLSLTLPESTDTSSSTQWDLPSGVDIEEQALEATIRHTMAAAFDDLSDLQQVVIAMRYYQGLDLSAISALIGSRLTTVRTAHAEGLLYLHAAMVAEAS